MTPADRDEVRTLAKLSIDSRESTFAERMMGHAILRYVPAGAVPPSLLAATAERRDDGRWVIDFDHGLCSPESARRIAAEFNAAADAAEES